MPADGTTPDAGVVERVVLSVKAGYWEHRPFVVSLAMAPS